MKDTAGKASTNRVNEKTEEEAVIPWIASHCPIVQHT